MMRTMIICCGLALIATAVMGEVATRAIEYQVDGKTMKGMLAWDDAIEGPRPGVIVFPEWWGVNEYAKTRARQLAEWGYIALAADMYGEGRMTEKPEEASAWSSEARESGNLVARARAAYEALLKQPQSDRQKMAAIGFCFGGYVALSLALSGADLDAVVGYHTDVPEPDPEKLKQIKATIMIQEGSADPYLKEDKLHQFRDALDREGVDWRIVMYGGAVHSFTNPGADKHGMKGVAYDEAAAELAWSITRVFLEQRFQNNQSAATGN